MDAEPNGKAAPSRRIALLIDADNVSHRQVAPMIGELAKHGVANIRRAYGDWASDGLKNWKVALHAYAIRPVQQFSYSTGKNASDMALLIDAMELLYTQKLDAFCIASSDADFTPLVMQLRDRGHEVYGFGERKTPEPFVNACSTFLYFDSLGETAPPPPPPGKAKVTPAAGAVTPPAAPESENPAKLRQDTKLVAVLRGAVEATAREDGWANLATAGSAAKRQAPIDPRNYRNYGVTNFPTLFQAIGLFDIAKCDQDGHAYVADKRNKERAEKPRPHMNDKH